MPFLINYYLEKTKELQRRFVAVPVNANPDIYLAITRWQCDKLIKGSRCHTVQRQGTPLLYVIKAPAVWRTARKRREKWPMFTTTENSHAQSSLIVEIGHQISDLNDMQITSSDVIWGHDPRAACVSGPRARLEQQTLARVRWGLLMIQSSDSTI